MAVEQAFAVLSARARTSAGADRDPEILVQRQESGVAEVIIGISSDDLLGRAILIGLGGLYTEVLRDVSVRPLPVTLDDVREMLGELRAYPLLAGARGGAAGDIEALSALVLKVADFAQDPTQGIVELDINPVIVKPSGSIAVDYLLVAAP
jgi:acyl-CoA synthetase (NDP forming)